MIILALRQQHGGRAGS